MRGWKQGNSFLSGKESGDCFDFILDVGIRGIYLSLALVNNKNLSLALITAKFKQLD